MGCILEPREEGPASSRDTDPTPGHLLPEVRENPTGPLSSAPPLPKRFQPGLAPGPDETTGSARGALCASSCAVGASRPAGSPRPLPRVLELEHLFRGCPAVASASPSFLACRGGYGKMKQVPRPAVHLSPRSFLAPPWEPSRTSPCSPCFSESLPSGALTSSRPAGGTAPPVPRDPRWEPWEPGWLRRCCSGGDSTGWPQATCPNPGTSRRPFKGEEEALQVTEGRI